MRLLNPSDVAEIESWPPYQGDMAQMDYALRSEGWLKECLSMPDVSLYAAEDGDDLVGFTILNRTGAEEAEFRIALRADKTGMGLGEGITLETLRIGFQDKNFSRIYLIVRKNNIRGINLYRRLGFVSCGECRKQIEGAIIDFWVMDIDTKQLKKEA
jgi:RimJ/RimL family protein N-acetyltransferase